jgi:hypothetical protein
MVTDRVAVIRQREIQLARIDGGIVGKLIK